MPFLPKKKVRRAIFSFDNEEQQPSSSRSTNQSQRTQNTDNNQSSNNETETYLLVTNCVRFILHCQFNRLPIKQIDLNSHLKENFNVDRKDFSKIIKLTKQKLLEDFGFNLIEIIDESGIKIFILHTIFKNDMLHADESIPDHNAPDLLDIHIPDEYNDNDGVNNDDINIGQQSYDEILNTSKRALLLISLSLIMLQESETLTEKELFAYLNEIGLCLDFKFDSAHDLPKNTIKAILSKDFVRQGYFKRTKKPNRDPTQPADYIYEWGIRSNIEFSKVDVLDFIKKIYLSEDVFLEQVEKNASTAERSRLQIISQSQNEFESN